MNVKMTLPGLRGTEHIGFTVPDLEQAVDFFVNIIGCEEIYRLGPFQSNDEWMKQQLNIHPRAVMRQLAFLRCAHGSNFEIFEYIAPDQNLHQPLNSDIGGHHLAFYVDDFDAALHFLRANGVTIQGEPIMRLAGPSAGQTWVYFLTPWNMQLELVSFPNGKSYEKETNRHLWSPVDPEK